MLADLALSVGANLITRAKGMKLKETKLTDLGTAKTIEATKTHTTVVGGQADYEAIEVQIARLKEEIKNEESMQLCDAMQQRITRLASGVGVIHVGAPTQVEMIEKKHRIEDALEAVKSAQVDGIVPGGGTALLRTATAIANSVEVDNEDQQRGVNIILEAMSGPIRQMAQNAGLSPDLIVSEVSSNQAPMGYNFRNLTSTNLLESGILDPVKVTTTALQNAVSAAGTLITTNYAIIQS